MIKTNYHTHCHYCDGKGKPRAYAENALDKGFAALGFSSHSPWKDSDCGIKERQVPRYIKDIQDLKEQYAGKLEIYLGMEIEYFPGFSSAQDAYYKTLPLEYRISSIHSLYDKIRERWYAIDYNVEEFNHILNELNGGMMENFARSYYGHIRDMVELGGFEILGHMDLIKKHNGDGVYFSEESSWYKEEVIATLDTIKGTGIIVEVNTGGIARGYTNTFYPSPWILEEACKREIPIQLNADAHAPENVDFWFDQALPLIKEAGYEKETLLLGGEWVEREL